VLSVKVTTLTLVSNVTLRNDHCLQGEYDSTRIYAHREAFNYGNENTQI